MDLEVKVVKVDPSEWSVLRELSIDTFNTSFAAENDPSNMKAYLDVYMSKTQIKKELEQEHSFFYFAKKGKKILGYLKLNVGAQQSESVLTNALEIERIYILEQYQGMQLGKLLLQFAQDKAKGWQKSVVWLGVWEHNTNAIEFYKYFGFEAFNSHSFRLGSETQTDLLMKKELE